jgi:hypothetical protein
MDHIDDNNALKFGIALQHSPIKKTEKEKREESKQLFSEECL